MEKQLSVLYEDNHLLVVVKEPNILTQGDQTGDEDLLSLVRRYVEEKYQKPGRAYIGLVHRMDRPVGGLLVFARTSKAAERLSKQVREHQLNREYVCVCEGQADARFRLVDYLKKDESRNMVTIVPEYLRAQGRLAILNGMTVATRDGRSLCTIRLETGRAHQIRVQMAHSGHPLIGDHRYGSGKGQEQIALYGMRLSFEHPTTHQKMTFLAPVPQGEQWKGFQKDLDGLVNVWPMV